jgi:histidinol-phosphatase (PHP family)
MQTPRIDTSIDGHMHTALCRHATGTMEEYVQAGVRKKLQKIFFLEHLETGIGYFETTWLSDQDFDTYFHEGRRLQRKYAGIIEIGLGVEVGYNPEAVEEILQKLAERPWDRIGISYHFLKTTAGYLNMVSSKQVNTKALGDYGVEQVITAYYQDLTEAVRRLPGDVLCHFDAALRYNPEFRTTERHDALIDALLDAVAEKKMAVEVNTSGYRIRNQPFPAPELLKKVIARNIPLVAGSDAHHPQEVGRYFDRLASLSLCFL